MNTVVKYFAEYREGKRLAYPHVAKEAPKFARSGSKDAAQSVTAEDLVFLSGCDGCNASTGTIDNTGIEQQIFAALDKVKAALEASGSSMDKMLKTFMLLKLLDDYPKMRKAEVEYYEKHAPHLVEYPPVSTFSRRTTPPTRCLEELGIPGC